MIQLVVNNNKAKILCSRKFFMQIQEDFKIRNPNAFFIRMQSNRLWDGKNKYITDAGYFATGLLPKVVAYMEFHRKNFEIIDERPEVRKAVLKKALQLNDFKARPYQEKALKDLSNYQLRGIPFPRGILGMATNAGKTYLSAAIHIMYGGKTLLLLNSKDLYGQAKDDIPKMLGEEYVGFIASNVKHIEWKPFMICMVPTMYSRLALYKKELLTYENCLVDECDIATSKMYQSVLQTLYNCTVRIGLSGSPFLHEDKNKNERLREFFGEVITEVSNRELTEKGYSSPVKVRMLAGNTTIKIPGDYAMEYELGIIKNVERNRKIRKRIMHHFRYGRSPMLVIAQRHEHIQRLYRMIKRYFDTLEDDAQYIRIEWVHHSRKDRKQIIDEFREGKIDVLIGSMILKRGMNFPLMRYILNAGAGRSASNIRQIFGRATRKSDTKKKTVLEDFFDIGAYLQIHSKVRLREYKVHVIPLEPYKNVINRNKNRAD